MVNEIENDASLAGLTAEEHGRVHDLDRGRVDQLEQRTRSTDSITSDFAFLPRPSRSRSLGDRDRLFRRRVFAELAAPLPR